VSDGTTETIATYEDGGAIYEIDHLGILHDSQWGEFAVYRAGQHVATFSIAESMLKPEFRPETMPVTTAELIALARGAVAEEEGGESTDQAQDESIAAFMATQDTRKTADPRLS
jgi:hypothetical protein